ncbi:hypothetical protein PUV54_06015 [Hyphococcus flavus]|uniref:Uncharacterized protein n=1 Tax=Hyphococcus flavus TaxID=1866326 RepID=A0AAE9ZKC0_9PROT|nr:hypothetical protein [Hyphococcus flavus]WDI32751.1 hypothetical protein PUV54_06015 [Hyphococcus flavus]
MAKVFSNATSPRRVFIGGLMLAAAACASSPEPDETVVVPPPLEPAEPVYVLGDILGADVDTVEAMFGAPALSRREGDGEYRRYAMSTCSLILILYPDEMGKPQVAHVDTTALGTSDEKPDLEECLAAG